MKAFSRTRTLACAGLVGATALLGACAPAGGGGGPAPTTTAPAGNVNTTTAVTYSCQGVGAAASIGIIANQTVNVVVNHPSTKAAGAAYSVTVTVPTLTLGAAPSFLDLNAVGIAPVIGMSATTGTINNAGPTTIVFTGNGLTGTIAPAVSNGVAGAAGTIVGTAGTINILSGGTGFVCTPVPSTSGATFSITVA